MISIALVEDEESSAKTLTELLARYERETETAFKIYRFTKAEDFLNNYIPQYDIVMMDICLPGVDGMKAAQLLRKYDSNVVLLFTTTMAQFAVQGYRVNAADYFIKPVPYYALKMRLDSVTAMLKHKDSRITVPVAGGTMNLPTSEIYYIESKGHQILFHTKQGTLESRGPTMRELAQKLDEYGFAKCNSCYIVNLEHCRGFKGDCVFVSDSELRMSRGEKKSFQERFAEYMQSGAIR